MDIRQADAPEGADQRNASPGPAPQMEASQPRPAGAPFQAAFGSGGGAALVFRDYASI